MAWHHLQAGQPLWAVAIAGMALLFNPFQPVHFHRHEWAWIDAISVLILLASPPAARPQEETMTLTKLQVATWQLDVAIRLFLEGDYLSSLTLAGAAEEILGRLSERAGKSVAVDAIVDYHWGDTDPAMTDEKRKDILLKVMNTPRNAVKHANNPGETHFVVEQCFPLQMIMRAMPMARALGAEITKEAEIVAWIHGHPDATR